MAYKSEQAYKTEFNALIVGATHMVGRAVQIRVNLAKVGKRGNRYATGPVAVATKAAFAVLGRLSTFKGEGERNPRPASTRPAARR